ncbi:MAG: PilZ domain-containing protein [Desulfosoma sp.]
MNNREYLRVRIPELSVLYNELPAGSSPPFFLGFGERREPPAEREAPVEDPGLAAVMESLAKLEAKVDRILGYLERHGALKPSYAHQGQVVDISGGGVSFATLSLHPVGAYLELCLIPQVGDPRPIYAIGKICWVEPVPEKAGSGAHHLGVKFVEIEEADRQAIIRLVFQLQRKEKDQRSVESGSSPEMGEPKGAEVDPCRRNG